MNKEELEKYLKEQIEVLKQEIKNKQLLLENLLNQLDNINDNDNDNDNNN